MYLRIEHDYPLKYIGNIDEISLWFDLLNNTIINHKGVKIVSIHTTEHEYLSFNIILECIVNSIKLFAVCIFKLKNIFKENFLYSIYIKTNEKG